MSTETTFQNGTSQVLEPHSGFPEGAVNGPGYKEALPEFGIQPQAATQAEKAAFVAPRTQGTPKPAVPTKRSLPKPAHDSKPKETHAEPKPEEGHARQPQSNDGDELEAPPAIPPLPTLPEINLPTKLSNYPAAAQSAIKAYINQEYPDATTEQQVEAILITIAKAVATYYAGDLKIIGLLAKVLDNANAARAVTGIAWKVLPASKKHQIYGAMAAYYKEVEGFANTIAKAEQTVLDKYSVLFNQPQLDEYQVNIAAWQKIIKVCEQYETTIN